MEEKHIGEYYCPKISEFHIGFEYEYLDDNLNNECQEYFDHTMDISDAWQDEFGDYHNDKSSPYSRVACIRVKYLDEEDVESFGFKSYKDFSDATGYVKVSHADDKSINKFDTMLIQNKTNKCMITIFDGTISNVHIFKGVIKNKSELKKLLIQLNIMIDE